MISRKALPRSCSPVRSRKLARRGVRKQRPVAHQEQLVALGRLVHHVAGDQQRDAAVGEPAEGAPEVLAEHWVEANGRLVEDQEIRTLQQRGRERDAGALSAGQ